MLAAVAGVGPSRAVAAVSAENSVEWEPLRAAWHAPSAEPLEERVPGGGSQLTWLARSVEAHVKQLNAACAERWGSPEGVDSEQLLREIASARRALRERLLRLQPEPDAPTEAVYDTLRQSLSSTQRRCATLNDDMLKVADANEELMTSMQTVKATNRRLAEQLQTQGDEIAQLTKLRLADEERLEELTQRHREEARRWRDDLGERVSATEADVAAVYQDKRAQVAARLLEKRRALRLLAPKLEGLRRLQAALASEARGNLAEWRSGAFERLAAWLADRLSSQRRADEAALVQLEDQVHARSARLTCEREARQREAIAWRQRDSELATEGRELAGRAEAELARLRAELQSAEAVRESDMRGAEQDRMAVCRRLRELATNTASLDVQLEGSRCAVVALEEQWMQKEAERQRLEEELRAAKQCLQKSDEALDKAMANNEDLRRQMEAQRVQAQSARSRAANERFQQKEAELADLLTEQRREALGLAERVGELEQRLGARAGEVARLQLTAERKVSERASLQRECALWKAQEELASRLCSEVEQGLREAKEDWEKQLQQLRAQSESLAVKQSVMEDELRSSQGASADVRRSSGQHAARAQAEASALDAKVREADEALGATRRSLQEKVAMLAAVRGEAGSLRAKAVLARDELERQLQQLTEDARKARERLLTEAGAERQRTQRAEMDCEELRRQGQAAMDEAQVEPRAQVAALERELQELCDRHGSEARQLGITLETNRRQIESMEVELSHQQGLLKEAEKQLQVETAALKAGRDTRVGAQEQLEKDVADERERLAASYARQGRRAAAASACNEEQAQQRREVEKLAADYEQQARDGEGRLDALRKQCASVLAARKDVMRAELERHARALDVADAENRRLRCSFPDPHASGPSTVSAASGSRSGPPPVAAAVAAGGAIAEPKARPSMEDSRWDVQDSIGRMQWHTDRLRRELHQQQRPGGAMAW